MTFKSKLTIKPNGHPHASKIKTSLPSGILRTCHGCRARMDTAAAYFYDVDALAWRIWCPACMASVGQIGGAK